MPGKRPPYSELEGDQVYIPFKPNSIFTTNFCPNSPDFLMFLLNNEIGSQFKNYYFPIDHDSYAINR